MRSTESSSARAVAGISDFSRAAAIVALWKPAARRFFPERLSLLCEGLPEKREKRIRFDAKVGELRAHCEPKDGGMNVGRWHERGWWKRQNAFYFRVQLRCSREQTIVARAG